MGWDGMEDGNSDKGKGGRRTFTTIHDRTMIAW